MKTLFDIVSVDRILSFLKEVDLFTKIWGLRLVFYTIELLFILLPFIDCNTDFVIQINNHINVFGIKWPIWVDVL